MVGVLHGHQWRTRFIATFAAWAVLVSSSGRAENLINFAAAGAPQEQPATTRPILPAPAQPEVGESTLPRHATVPRRMHRRHPRVVSAAREAPPGTQRESADDVPKDGQESGLGQRTNGNTIAIMSGRIDGTAAAVASDMAAVLDDGDNLRVLPVLSTGGGQNIRDVRFMSGVDLGITQSNLLNDYKRTSQIGPIDDKIVYLAKLFNEEMHVLVRAQSGITALEQLAGKRVNFGEVGGGTQLTARDVFARLGVKAAEVNLDPAKALAKLQTGEIAATVLIAGKPATALAGVSAADGYRLLPVPYSKELQKDYLPASLDSRDYPATIEGGRSIDTVAVGVVLIAYNWPKDSDRYRRIAKFVEAFFPRLAEFQRPPRHPKWREVSLAANLPGWKRFDAAEEWVQRSRQQAQGGLRQFDDFLAARDAPSGNAQGRAALDRERLFQEFLKWNRARERR
jgi:uncharacterized protein